MFVIASGADSCHISVYPSVQFDPAAENRAQAIGIAKTTSSRVAPIKTSTVAAPKRQAQFLHLSIERRHHSCRQRAGPARILRHAGKEKTRPRRLHSTSN